MNESARMRGMKLLEPDHKCISVGHLRTNAQWFVERFNKSVKLKVSVLSYKYQSYYTVRRLPLLTSTAKSFFDTLWRHFISGFSRFQDSQISVPQVPFRPMRHEMMPLLSEGVVNGSRRGVKVD
jgi:hypothetical protein